ncbi:hypothetical protein, partial [Staphylococcus aureus]|uniref:hypothetical protein n=1 Tax=Staphylococcus aureus TaxID=1280 RepID=UPI001C4F50E0
NTKYYFKHKVRYLFSNFATEPFKIINLKKHKLTLGKVCYNFILYMRIIVSMLTVVDKYILFLIQKITNK